MVAGAAGGAENAGKAAGRICNPAQLSAPSIARVPIMISVGFSMVVILMVSTHLAQVASVRVVLYDLLCMVFPRYARKNHTPIKERTALPKAKSPTAFVV